MFHRIMRQLRITQSRHSQPHAPPHIFSTFAKITFHTYVYITLTRHAISITINYLLIAYKYSKRKNNEMVWLTIFTYLSYVEKSISTS